ncbi:MAG: hypothetical protein FJ100_22055 [Deltaproteobacteria bacterium]|nr:hypothetical protein [Deltaproteobacteria bacterium]
MPLSAGVGALGQAPAVVATFPWSAGSHVCQALPFLTSWTLDLVARLCTGKLIGTSTDGLKVSPPASGWKWSEKNGEQPSDPCHTPMGVDDLSVLPNLQGAAGQAIHTLKRAPKCVTAWPSIRPITFGTELGVLTTDVIAPIPGQPFTLLAPRRVVEAPGGTAVLDVDPNNGAQVRIARMAPFGLPARLDVIDLDPPPAKLTHAPWGMAFRADAGVALAAESGLYFAAPGAKVAKLVVPWPAAAVQPEDGLARGCCDIGWLKDPLAGGAFLIGRGDHVLVVHDHTFQVALNWAPTWGQSTVMPAARPRIRSLMTSPALGSFTLVEVREDNQERVVVYGFGLAGAPLGALFPPGWRPPPYPAPAP